MKCSKVKVNSWTKALSLYLCGYPINQGICNHTEFPQSVTSIEYTLVLWCHLCSAATTVYLRNIYFIFVLFLLTRVNNQTALTNIINLIILIILLNTLMTHSVYPVIPHHPSNALSIRRYLHTLREKKQQVTTNIHDPCDTVIYRILINSIIWISLSRVTADYLIHVNDLWWIYSYPVIDHIQSF